MRDEVLLGVLLSVMDLSEKDCTDGKGEVVLDIAHQWAFTYHKQGDRLGELVAAAACWYAKAFAPNPTPRLSCFPRCLWCLGEALLLMSEV